jgi:hypothetical protein
MRTSPAVLLTILLGTLVGLGCGGNGASGPVVAVSPATLTVSTGDGATTFLASLSNGAVDPVTWTLSGPGAISATTGDTTSYQPPALGEGGGTATLRATAGCGANCVAVGDTATITVNTATTGTLTITVQLQGGTQASLAVTGPGYSQTVTTSFSTTLTGLSPGSYTITGAPIVVQDLIVNSQYVAPPVTVAVVANAAATAMVNYASIPGYGMLWVPGANLFSLDGFASGDLTVNKAPSLTPGTAAQVQGIAFDISGNMWASLAGPGAGSVVHYPAAGLANPGQLTPDVTLADARIASPAGVALGPDGRIWVANCAPDSITAYPLLGASTPDIVITNPGAGLLKCPRGIAFDSTGNLWVANKNGVAERFPSTQLGSTNSNASVDVTLTAPPNSSQPYAVALDENGNVWVAFCSGSTVASYASASFPGTTTPAAVLTSLLTAMPRTLDCPVALALDNSGLLWVANAGTDAGPSLSQFGATDMMNGNDAGTQVSVTGIGVTVGGMAFNPTAPGLPLRH